MTSEEFARIGAALYGGPKAWQAAFSRDSGISQKHINRIASGECPVSRRAAVAMADAADARLSEVAQAERAAAIAVAEMRERAAR